MENALKMKFLIGICCVLWYLSKCVGSEMLKSLPGSEELNTALFKSGTETSTISTDNVMKNSNKSLPMSIDQNIVVTTDTDICFLDADQEFGANVPADADLQKPEIRHQAGQARCVLVMKLTDCIWRNGVQYLWKESEEILNSTLYNTSTWETYSDECPRQSCMCIDRVVSNYIKTMNTISPAGPGAKEQLNQEGCMLMNKMRSCVLNNQNCKRTMVSFKIIELWARKVDLFNGKYDENSVLTAYKDYCNQDSLIPEMYNWIEIPTRCINCKNKEKIVHGQVVGQISHQDDPPQWNTKNTVLVAILSLVVLALATFLFYILCQIARYKEESQRYTRVETRSP